jgi:hypothetical protein
MLGVLPVREPSEAARPQSRALPDPSHPVMAAMPLPRNRPAKASCYSAFMPIHLGFSVVASDAEAARPASESTWRTGDVPPISVAQGFGVFRHCNDLDGQLLCVLSGRQPAQ